ncbi:MAG TPA: hypothetical protein ENK18_18195 [Deltaproteobacteria bacterium]|nr:hypothetical protein [Deltaproteobacteria bacterium]
MLRWLGPLLVLAACGGDDKDDPTPPDPGATDLEDTAIAGLCDGIRTYDLDGLGCDQLQSAYFQLLDDASACSGDGDCLSLDSRCAQLGGIGACSMPANTCVDQAGLDAIVSRWSPCFSAVGCPYDCGPSTPACVGGRCVLQ